MPKKKNKRRADYKAPTTATGKSSTEAVGDTPAGVSTKQQARAVPARPSGNRAANRRGETASTLSWWLLGGGIVAVVVAVIVFSSIGGESQEGVTEATSWELPALVENQADDDGRVNLADYRGTPVVLNFFASWCVACEREMPLFRQAVDDFEGDIKVLFINSNETGNWEPMAERAGVMDQVIIDDIGGSRNNGLYRSLGGTGGMPLTAWYDADGALTNVAPGEYDGSRLYAEIEAAIAS